MIVNNVPIVLQIENTECGVACLAMVLRYYNCYVSLDDLRAECGVGRLGASATAVLRAARKYGLKSEGIKVEPNNIENIQTPAILFWNFNHYVVYRGCNKSKTIHYITDPAIGEVVYDNETFEKCFTGVALNFTPTEKMQRYDKDESFHKYLVDIVRSNRRDVIKILWALFLIIIPILAVPSSMLVFIDNVVISGNAWSRELIIILLSAFFIQFIICTYISVILQRNQVIWSANYTLALLKRSFKLPISFFAQRHISDLSIRFRLPSQIVAEALGVLIPNLLSLIVIVCLALLMVLYSWQLTIVTLIAIVFNFLVSVPLSTKISISQSRVRLAFSRLEQNMLMGISNLVDIKACGREDGLFIKWCNNLAVYNNEYLRLKTLQTFMTSWRLSLLVLGAVVETLVGYWLIMNGKMSYGELVAFVCIYTAIFAPFDTKGGVKSSVLKIKKRLDRVTDIEQAAVDDIFKDEQKEEQDDIQTPIGNAQTLSNSGYLQSSSLSTINDSGYILELKNVSFTYKGCIEPLISNISFKVRLGQRVAIVGPSGSGKSTLAKILSGIYKHDSGELLLNNRPYNTYTNKEFASIVGIVSQNPNIFSGSVSDNLTMFATNFDAKVLNKSLETVRLDKELIHRGEILSLSLTENGSNLSGGQRQRIELARALSNNPQLLILDEATSALDPMMEQQIEYNMQSFSGSLIMVAHRLSFVKSADMIIVLDKGHIIDIGNHDELLERCDIYADLVSLDGASVC